MLVLLAYHHIPAEALLHDGIEQCALVTGWLIEWERFTKADSSRLACHELDITGALDTRALGASSWACSFASSHLRVRVLCRPEAIMELKWPNSGGNAARGKGVWVCAWLPVCSAMVIAFRVPPTVQLCKRREKTACQQTWSQDASHEALGANHCVHLHVGDRKVGCSETSTQFWQELFVALLARAGGVVVEGS